MSNWEDHRLVTGGGTEEPTLTPKWEKRGGCGRSRGAGWGVHLPSWSKREPLSTAPADHCRPTSQGVLQPAGCLPSSAENPGFLCFCFPTSQSPCEDPLTRGPSGDWQVVCRGSRRAGPARSRDAALLPACLPIFPEA